MHSSLPCCLPNELLANAVPLTALERVLDEVIAAGPGATGALSFGARGVVLLEHGRVCWAVARSMQKRLTDLLRHQVEPPLSTLLVENVYRDCLQKGRPLGEALVETGKVTASGLRASLRQHNAEAIAHIALGWDGRVAFHPHKNQRYDARYVFSTAELLVSFAAIREPERAKHAKSVLRSVLDPGSLALGFVPSAAGGAPWPLSLLAGGGLTYHEVLDLCAWAEARLALCRTFSPATRFSSTILNNGASALTFMEAGLEYVLFCESRHALARTLTRVRTRLSGVRVA